MLPIYIYIYIYMCVCVCVCVCVHMLVCVCVCVYFGSISPLIKISLNIIDIFCLHIFWLILSYCRINLIFKPVLMVLNVFSYTLQRRRCSSSYKVIMYIQKLHHFCNTSSPDDGPKSSRKYSGNKQLWKIYQSIPSEYYKNQCGNNKK